MCDKKWTITNKYMKIKKIYYIIRYLYFLIIFKTGKNDICIFILILVKVKYSKLIMDFNEILGKQTRLFF